jgi:hypothetical protein
VKELAAGDTRLAGTAAGFKVKAIENEKSSRWKVTTFGGFKFPLTLQSPLDVLKRIDTKIVFQKVFTLSI